jgi:[ribosomal protein S18]-alanine N-acetyltransferase
MSADGYSVRPLSYADLPQVIAIERRTFTTPWSLAMFVLELSKSSGLCLAATDGDGELLGYLICSRFDTVWHLMNIAVDPSERRRGIGSALLDQMIERAGPDEEYTLEVRPSNSHAITLYERLGFRPAGRRPRYYRDNGEDALIMWRTLEASTESTASG